MCHILVLSCFVGGGIQGNSANQLLILHYTSFEPQLSRAHCQIHGVAWCHYM